MVTSGTPRLRNVSDFVGELMASFSQCECLSLKPEGKPTGTDVSSAVRKMCGTSARRWDGKVWHRSLCGPCAPEVLWSRMHGFSPSTSRNLTSWQHVQPMLSEIVGHHGSIHPILSQKG